jgi:hypothetical protein
MRDGNVTAVLAANRNEAGSCIARRRPKGKGFTKVPKVIVSYSFV